MIVRLRHIVAICSLFAFSFIANETLAQRPIPVRFDKGTVSNASGERDGSGSLGNSYNYTACGLNYVQASQMVTTRYTPNPGTGLPTNLSISGIPPCAVIEQAFLYWTASTSSTDGSFSITNPDPNTFNLTATHIGSCVDKCWGLGGSQNFRGDVTTAISGDGTYTVDITMGDNAVDGVTLLIIYSDPAATYQGTMVIDDGCLVNTSGGTENHTVSGFTACDNSSAASAFLIVADMQDNVAADHPTTLNGTTNNFSNNFWNFDQINTTVTSGQSTSGFGANGNGSDCFDIIATGLYFQTTTCVSCTNSGSSATIAVTDVTCFGACDGAATVSVTGTNTPYSFQWDANAGSSTSATVSSLCANTYAVTITDGVGCTFSQSAIVNEPTQLTATASGTDISCFGLCDGSASVSVSGGATPYAYSWSNASTSVSITALCQGTYTITVTDNNNCSATDSYNVVEPAALSFSSTSTDATCNGLCDGSITTTTSGGATPYSYLWSDGATTASQSDLCANSYSITLTDNGGCTMVTSDVVGQASAFVVSVSVTNASCNGGSDGSATVSASGGSTPYGYQWDANAGGVTTPTANNLSANTYQVTVSDANSCIAIISATVNEPPALSLTTTVTDVSCNGGADGEILCQVGGGVSAYSFLWNTGQVTSSISALPAGNYCVTVTDANGCTIIDCPIIAEPSALSDNVTTTDATCSGTPDGSADLTVNGGVTPYSYEWSNGYTTEDIVNVLSGPYTVTTTDNNSCTIVTNVTISEPGGLALNVTSTDVSCNSAANGTATANVTGGTTPYIYLWNGSQTTVTVTGLIAGVHTVTVTDDNGCSLSASVNIAEPTAITLTTTTDSVMCNGGSDGEATAIASGGVSPYDFQWDGNTGGVITPTAINLAANTYQVTVTDANNCTAVASATVEEPTLLTIPGPGFSATMASCPGACDGEAVVLPQGGVTPYSYNWSPAPGAGQGTFYATGFCAGNYTLEVTDANGCTVTNPFVITDPDNITLDTAITASSCGQNDGSITVSNVSGGTSPYTYLWDNNTGNQTTPTAGSLIDGNYSLTITDDNNCSYSFVFEVGSVPGPDISVTGTNTTCYGDCDGTASVGFNVSGTSPYVYSWSNSGNAQNLTGLCAGAYAVTVTDDNGCSDQASVTITEPSKVSVTPSSDVIICQGASTTLSATASGGNGSPYTYEWNFQPGTNTNTVSPSSPTTYDVVATDAMGCESDVEQVFVDLYDPLSVIVFNDQKICRGGSASLNVMATGGNGNYTYIWSDGTTTTSATVTKTPGSYPAATTYYVTVTDRCTTPETVGSVTISYHPVPLASFVVDTSKGCAPHTVTFTNTSPQSMACTWDMDDGSNPVGGCSTFSYQYTQPGTYDVSLTVLSDKLCESNPFTDQIIVHPNPIADFHIGNQPTTTLNTFIPFKDLTISTEAINTWSWTFFGNDGETPIGTSQNQNPSYEYPADTGTYPVYLQVTTINNCVDDTMLYPFIDADFALYTPNAFTPNGDGLNDYFFPKGIGINDEKFSFMIFDRWGNIIFESTSPDDHWDGTARKIGGSKIVQDGVYIWKVVVADIKREPQRHFYTGHVTLLK